MRNEQPYIRSELMDIKQSDELDISCKATSLVGNDRKVMSCIPKRIKTMIVIPLLIFAFLILGTQAYARGGGGGRSHGGGSHRGGGVSYHRGGGGSRGGGFYGGGGGYRRGGGGFRGSVFYGVQGGSVQYCSPQLATTTFG